MEQNRITRVLDAVQDWGWHVGISVFLILVAIMSISQAIEDFNYWRYLDAGWWFIVFYLVLSIIIYLVTDKVKSLWNSRKQLQNMEQMSVNMEIVKKRTEQIIGTRDLFLETLVKIGCQYEVDEDDRIIFAWQGGHFIADAENDSPFVVVWYQFWAEYELYDIDAVSRMKRVINYANITYNLNVIYSMNEAGSTFHVHSKKHFLFVTQVPDLGGYLQSILTQFFTVQRYVEIELDKMKNEEEKIGR